MGTMSAEITKPMPKPASKILGYGPGQIIVIIGKLIMAKITPMPCPTPKALETISQARANKKTFGRDIATTESTSQTGPSRNSATGGKSSIKRQIPSLLLRNQMAVLG